MHAAKLMKRETLDDPIPVATQAEVDAFKRSRGPGPSIEEFRVHLNGKGLASKWNEAAASLFAEDLTRTGWAEDTAPMRIREMFTVHLVTLRNQHRSQNDGGVELTQAQRGKRKGENRLHRRRYVSAVHGLDCHRRR